MSKIRIKNFGPIKEGYQENDGWLAVKKVTVFIGNQGSGKSTVAKLISTLSWIEKALNRGDLVKERFHFDELNKQFQYQRIDNYFHSDTEIEYSGDAYSINDKKGYIEVKAANSSPERYLVPKIMYVPSERNFLSVIDRPDKIKNLPTPLYTFNDEFDAARNRFGNGIELPINKARFQYDKSRELMHIVGDGNSYRLKLSESSSGFQSAVPLYLVTKYLNESLNLEENISIKGNSVEEQRKLDMEVKAIMEDPKLTPEIRQAYLRQLSTKRKPVCFINIVEEPEQNLFPSSQQSVLNELLKSVNTAEGNKLIMTTHSPYIINYLTLAAKAHTLKERVKTNELKSRLNEIVPLSSTIDPDDLVIYELDEKDGSIKKLGNYEGIPSDKNYLNKSLALGNKLFDTLLEIEEEI